MRHIKTKRRWERRTKKEEVWTSGEVVGTGMWREEEGGGVGNPFISPLAVERLDPTPPITNNDKREGGKRMKHHLTPLSSKTVTVI